MDDIQGAETCEIQYNQLSAFCADAIRKVSWAYIASLMLAAIIAFAVYYLTRSQPLGSVRPALLVYYVIAGLHLIRRLKQGGKANILSPDILFLIFYTLFHLGYVALYGFGFVPYSDAVFVFESSIPKALFIVNLGLVSFLLGYEVLGSRSSTPRITGPVRIPGASWCTFGLICMIIAVVAHLSIIGYLGLAFFRQYGYRIFQDVEKYSGSFLLALIWRYALHLMAIGLVVYTVSSALRHGKLFKSKLALGLVVMYFSLVLMEGDRGPLVQLGAPILIVRHYFVKPIRIRYLLVMAIIVLILFTAMALVRIIVFEPAKMLEEYKYKRAAGFATWISPFVEMGHSFLVVNITAHEVPSAEPYWLGASWRDATTHIVPFLQGFLLRRGFGTWPPSAWITTTYYGTEAAGRAFTVAAEGYLNFSYPGVIIELMFFGIFIRWLTMRFSRNPSPMWGIIMIGCIGISIMTIRNQVSIMFAPCVRVIVVAALLNLFLAYGPSYGYETEEGTMLPYGDTAYTQY